MPMPTPLRYLQYTGFVFTEVLNILLFVLIWKRASNKFGAYKYLMATFTIFSLVFGVVEVLTMPVIHVEGTALILFVDSFLKYDKVIGYHMASIYCTTYGVCVFLLTTHFFYRYLAVCRPQAIRFLSGKRLLYIFIPTLIFGIVWLANVELSNHPNELTSEYLKESLKLYYDEDSYAVAQLAKVYYKYDENHNLVIHWIHISSIIILSSIMAFSIFLIIIFGLKTYKSVKSHTNMSSATRDLHRQLLHTLILQSLVPFFILFLPVTLIFLLPFFNVHLGYFANTTSAWISFYPAIDAIIVILMIRDFRKPFLCCKRFQTSAKVTVNLDSLVTTDFRRRPSQMP